MATFDYQALTRSGRQMRGTLESSSREEAEKTLAEMGLRVSDVTVVHSQRPRGRVGRTELLLFNQQLASIAKAGIPLERSLRELSADVESSSMRRLVVELADDLESGVPVEDAFERRRALFPPLYGRIVEAGIRSGRLSEMLTSLNRHLEISSQTRRMIIEATSYPLVVLVLSLALVTVVFSVIFPRLTPILLEMSGRLPWITRFFLATAPRAWMIWPGLGVLCIALFAIRAWLLRSPGGRWFLEGIRLRIPILGRAYHRSVLARLADSMALLVGAGCDLPSCLRMGAAATGSETLRLDCEALAEAVEQGNSVAEADSLCPSLPSLFSYSLQVGVQRNELQDSLYSMSEMYMQQTLAQQSRVQALLMPVLVILVGGIVGLSIVAVFMPLMQMIRGIQG
jgi:type IV pilus assembly protein PilC